jgi:hypothetical protein
VVWFITKKLKFKKTNYKFAILAALLVFILGIVFGRLLFLIPMTVAIHELVYTYLLSAVDLITGMVLIKYLYKESWENSGNAAIVWWLTGLALGYISTLVFVPIIASIISVISGI